MKFSIKYTISELFLLINIIRSCFIYAMSIANYYVGIANYATRFLKNLTLRTIPSNVKSCFYRKLCLNAVTQWSACRYRQSSSSSYHRNKNSRAVELCPHCKTLSSIFGRLPRSVASPEFHPSIEGTRVHRGIRERDADWQTSSS